MTDIEISRKCKLLNIIDIADKLGINHDDLICYGNNKAKINNVQFNNIGKLILVTAINPTPYGEGKTTVSIGLDDALCSLGYNSILSLRQPSMGPVFGMKGGATGGGYSQVVPMEDINLHFTGDFHAITSANNLLCAAIDNHIYQGNELDIQKVIFNRCLDVNDRALRQVDIGRDEKFNITAASEIMAIFCLADSIENLRKRLGNIIIGYNSLDKVIYARDLEIEDALTVLLKDAFMPNLVQTLENNPALIHGGPFANIAHGCSSLVATKLGLSLSDYVVTEAGFGADLGAEKFFDIKCQAGNLNSAAVVLVATIKALKYNANISYENINFENIEAVKIGLSNLDAHIKNLSKFTTNIIVCLNKYDTDNDLEIDVVKKYCIDNNIKFSISTAYKDGSSGAIDLARKVVSLCNNESYIKPLYNYNYSIESKINKICTEIYHANKVEYSDIAINKIKKLENNNFSNLPICVAKTQYSLSDDSKKLGNPSNYTITVRDIEVYNGAGFITVLLGNIIKMPGLPKKPNYLKIKLDEENNIVGLS